MIGSIHGGAFWDEVGNDLAKLSSVVRADVLDAWFPPAPRVLQALSEFATELCRTSPEAGALPLRRAISQARGIPEQSILIGGGSSALIFLALPHLAAKCKSALILDPMYGEYRHVLERLCELPVSALRLHRQNRYELDPSLLEEFDADLVALVNPNSPTGQHIPGHILRPIVEELAHTRTVWIDETYSEYAGTGQTLEELAAINRNVIVCKSMSKVYALSGLRIGYLVSHPDRIAELEQWHAPWSVSLPAQVAGAVGLEEPAYYRGRYDETAELRTCLSRSLSAIGLEFTEGTINSLLVHLPVDGPASDCVCREVAKRGVYLRDAASMGRSMGNHTLRVSVRDHLENARVVDSLQSIIFGTPAVPWG